MDAEQLAELQQQQGMDTQTGLQQTQQRMMLQDQEKGMIKEQLDLNQELEDIEHLLRGDVQKNEDGIVTWESPKDTSLVVLTEAGIHFILNSVRWYLSKNTLLSNFSEEAINQKMEDFANTLSDTLFMKYDVYFKQPTIQDCKDEIQKRIKNKLDVKMFAREMLDIKVDEEEEEKMKSEIIKEMEGTIARELMIIKEQKRKESLKMYDFIVRVVQDSVHSTYNRAYRGEERSSLRKHMTFSNSEITGTATKPQQSGGGMFGWLKH